MNLPPFENFLKSLGPYPGDAIYAEALLDDLRDDASPYEIVACSYSVTLIFLKRYHHWLSQQIDVSPD